MAARHSRHIALTGPLASYVDETVARGEYASVSEMVRAALRLLAERDAAKPARADIPEHNEPGTREHTP